MNQLWLRFTVGAISYTSSWVGDFFVFPHVITNAGNGYNTSTPNFTTSRNETYVFYVTAVSYNNNRLSVDMFHDGVSKARTYSTNSG